MIDSPISSIYLFLFVVVCMSKLTNINTQLIQRRSFFFLKLLLKSVSIKKKKKYKKKKKQCFLFFLKSHTTLNTHLCMGKQNESSLCTFLSVPLVLTSGNCLGIPAFDLRGITSYLLLIVTFSKKKKKEKKKIEGREKKKKRIFSLGSY